MGLFTFLKRIKYGSPEVREVGHIEFSIAGVPTEIVVVELEADENGKKNAGIRIKRRHDTLYMALPAEKVDKLHDLLRQATR
ncbi:hypothetical protein K2X33_16285 [bacterium]|nr:hypothetical protein [bacterium]